MGFNNPVKNEIVTREVPCGFSKSQHKKMVKKRFEKQMTIEDLENVGFALGRAFKIIYDGISSGFNKALETVEVAEYHSCELCEESKETDLQLDDGTFVCEDYAAFYGQD